MSPSTLSSSTGSRSRLARSARLGLVLVLTVELALWGAFLVPLRVHGHAVPVGVLLALATVPLCRAGGRALGRRGGAAAPMLLWAVIVVVLSGSRREGDLVLLNDLRGLGFLVLGLLGAALAVGTWRP